MCLVLVSGTKLSYCSFKCSILTGELEPDLDRYVVADSFQVELFPNYDVLLLVQKICVSIKNISLMHAGAVAYGLISVSYTHLTLPTICSV